MRFILIRRPTQVSALLLLAVLPLIGRGNALYEAYGAGAQHVGSLATRWEAFLYHAYAFLFGWLEDPGRVSELFHGSFWSITLFGYTINDPLAVAGHAAATGSAHWPLVLGALSPVILAAVAGRAFCGWLCPINTILEVNAKFRRFLEKRVVRGRLPDAGWGTRPRYLVLVAGLVASAVVGANAFAAILPYAGIARDWHLAAYGMGFGAGATFLVVLLAVELLIAPRIWCRSLCPTGLVLGLLGTRRALGIGRRAEKTCLSGCKLCITTCPVGVNPRDGLSTEECMMCNECVSSCPADVLQITLGKPRNILKPITILVAVAAFLGSFPLEARAHHVAALPHYGYLENYPQTPAIEEQIVSPPYIATLAAYLLEGLKGETSDTPDDAIVFVALEEEATGKPYLGPLEISLRPRGGGDPLLRKFSGPIEESVYRLRATLPGNAYDVAIILPGASEPAAVIPLVLKSGPNLWIIGSLLILLSVVLGIGRSALRRRRFRGPRKAAPAS